MTPQPKPDEIPKWVTEYANAADDGAPYVGPTIFAEDIDGARAIAALIEGPDGESFTVLGDHSTWRRVSMLIRRPSGRDTEKKKGGERT